VALSGRSWSAKLVPAFAGRGVLHETFASKQANSNYIPLEIQYRVHLVSVANMLTNLDGISSLLPAHQGIS
jgi:hypothetical protein